MRTIFVGVVFLLPPLTDVAGQENWPLTLEARVGEVEGPNALSAVRDVAVAADGTLYIALPQERAVGVFDREGVRIRTIGRGGEGPGEFQDILRLGIYEGQLWTVDHRLRRLSFFDLTGKFVESVNWFNQYIPARPLGQDRFSAIFTSSGPPPTTEFAITYRRNGMIADTIASLPGRYTPLRIGNANVGNPLSWHTLTAYSPDSKYFVLVERPLPANRREGEFKVAWVDVNTKTRRDRSFRYVPKELSEEASAALLDQLPPALRDHDDARKQIRNYRYIPPISAIVVGADTSVWLARERIDQELIRWYKVGASNELEGYVTLPANHRIVGGDANRIWTLSHDLFGVPYVSRYRYR